MFDFNISEEYRLAPLKILPPKSQQAKPKRFHIKLPVADPAGSQTDLSPTTKIVYSIMEPAKLKLHAYSPMNTLRTEKSLKDLNLPGNLSDRLPTNEYSPLLKNGELRMVPKRHIKDSASQTWRDNQYIQEEFSKAWASNSNFLRSSLPKMNHSQKLSKTTRKQENELSIKRARQEVAALQANLSKAMDRSKEKLIVEELRDFSPERKDIKNAYEEIENLRKLTNSKLTKCERHLAPLNSTERQKTQKNPESPKSSRLYQMGSEDKLDVAYYLSKPAVSAATKLNISSSGLLPEYYDSKAAISTLIGDKNLAEKQPTHDPFDKLILYQNEKMPFSLAVMAKTRHKIFEEVKNRPGNYKEKRKIGYVKDLREKLVPEEKAKFLEQLDESEKQKKYKEMQSKKAQTNAIYQLAAMNKASQMRVKAKMKEQLPVNSRFLTL